MAASPSTPFQSMPAHSIQSTPNPVHGVLHAPHAFIIDLDGSTVDTLGDFVEVLSRVLAELQLQLLAVARGFEELTSGLYLCLKRRRRPA